MQKLDVDVFNDQGKICARMIGFSIRVLDEELELEHQGQESISKGSNKPLLGVTMLSPLWDAISLPEKSPLFPEARARMIIAGGNSEQRNTIYAVYPNSAVLEIEPEDRIEEIESQLKTLSPIDHLIWIAPDRPMRSVADETLIQEQAQGVLEVFRLVKALFSLGYGNKDLGWTVITTQTQAVYKKDSVNSTHVGIHGFIGSLAKENPHWKIRLLDMEEGQDWPIDEMFTLSVDVQGNTLSHRGKEWFRQTLTPIRNLPRNQPLYRAKGVYVVIGGTGGIGAAWSESVIEKYHAQIIWIGRRKKDETIQAKLDSLAKLGPVPAYIQADATDYKSLQRAYQEIKQRFSQIHGVIHSAVGVFDQNVADMEENRFRRILSAKIDISVRMAQVFQNESLDFILFFSSLAAFERAGGMSGYSAGCVFKDAFSRQFSKEWPCAVKVINWGYWNVGTGDRISKAAKIRLKQRGIEPIQPKEGMTALEELLASPLDQLALVKILRPQAIGEMNSEEWITAYPERVIPCIGRLHNLFPELAVQAEDIKSAEYIQHGAMETLLLKLLRGSLQSLGLFKERGQRSVDVKSNMNLLSLYERWFEESLRILRSNGYLLQYDGERDLTMGRSADLDLLWQEWDHAKIAWEQNSGQKAQVILVEACMHALPEIITGKREATDILFPNSSMDLVEGIYKGTSVADLFNDVLATVVVAYVEERLSQDLSAKIRLLEIGAGTGGTTAFLLPKLHPFRHRIEEYCYTDLSKSFLFHADEHFVRQYPYVKTQIFDVEMPPAYQNIPVNHYDVVIAANVLHATKSIRRTLQNTKATLRKNGLIVLNEISRKSLFAHLTFGLLKGWWLTEDKQLRIPGCPGLYSKAWQRVLEEEGFNSVLFPAEATHKLGQQIILAESNGIIRQKQPLNSEVDPLKTKALLPIDAEKSYPRSGLGNTRDGVTEEYLREKSTRYLKKLVGKTLKMESHQIDSLEPLETYGIDSILIVQITNKLNEAFDDISSALLFEFQTLDALADHLIKTQRDSLIRLLGLDHRKLEEESMSRDEMENQRKSNKSKRKRTIANRFLAFRNTKVDETSESIQSPIAIIGMSGRYPQAKNIEEYWQNLAAGKDCVTEVPEDRWALEGFYHPDQQEAAAIGKSYSKWGGFVDGFAEFDPLFFNISPREAMTMDPQERLFLQGSWEVLEDAGYTKKHLAEQFNGRIGVFAGITKTGFNLYGPDLWKQGEKVYPNTSFSSVANRISYLLNLQGPSIPIDTMCSSSLTAIHEACEHIRHHDCVMAIAGGVNLYLHPSTYIPLCSMQMLSRDGKCKSFGKGGNGFVPGEGVGVVLLKHLSQAIRDHDHIYGIIRGSNVNHGGKTNGYTVPNPKAQAQLIQESLEKAGVNARALSYVEAHGTGTELGDPIEITGLTQAFQKDTSDIGFCALGSVKSNLGHLEAAAGIAGLSKIILQMEHGQLVPSLHAQELNPKIHFGKTPFAVQQKLGEWKRPTVTVSGETKKYPRIAGISSFGAGGSNAHLIIEEYIQEGSGFKVQGSGLGNNDPCLIVLSAKNEDRLKKSAKNLLTYVTVNREPGTLNLHEVAYTLQVGREAMEERLAFIAQSTEDLQEKLKGFIDSQEDVQDLYRGQVKRNKDTLAVFAADEELQEALDKWIQRGKYSKLLDLWVKGLEFNWSKLYGDTKPQRVSLPTYPFAKERYWINESAHKNLGHQSSIINHQSSHLHPLVHENTSNLETQRFCSTFTGEEFFFAGHVVQGQNILSEVACLEMARAAVEQAAGWDTKDQPSVELKDIVWARPIVANGRAQAVHIELFPEENGRIQYEIYTEIENEEESVVHSQGVATFMASDKVPSLSLRSLRAAMNQGHLSSKQCYDAFKSMGIDYGRCHQGLRSVYVGEDQVLAKWSLPSSVLETQDQFVLHPCLMDSALQASNAFDQIKDQNSKTPGAIAEAVPLRAGKNLCFPSALQKLDIFGSCTTSMWTWIRISDSNAGDNMIRKLDVDLCDDQGKVAFRMKGLSSGSLEGELGLVRRINETLSKNSPMLLNPEHLTFQGSDSSRLKTVNPSVAEPAMWAKESLVGLTVLSPAWNVIRLQKRSPLVPEASARVFIVGGSKKQRNTIREAYPHAELLEIHYQDGIEKMVSQLNALAPVQHLVWIAPDGTMQSLTDEALIQDQTLGVMQIFRIVKALLFLGYGNKDLGLTVITTQTQAVHKKDSVNPTHAGIHGLIGSLANEYPHWKIRLLDLEEGQDWPIHEMFTLPFNVHGDALTYRGKEWFLQALIPVRNLAENPPVYRAKGVYVLIGGAGGIGAAWSQSMIEKYEAQIIWIGRRRKDEAIQAKLDVLAQLGSAPVYIQADATDLNSMKLAYQEIKKDHPQIHGVIHSATGIFDQSLVDLTEDRFRTILAVKVEVSVRIAQVFKNEPLDFVLFFSSLAAFEKAGGFSGYSAGCTFKDAFSHQLSKEWPCAVKVMNWGYWSTSEQETQFLKPRRFAMEQRGIRTDSIARRHGTPWRRFWLSSLDQLALTEDPRTSKPVKWIQI